MPPIHIRHHRASWPPMASVQTGRSPEVNTKTVAPGVAVNLAKNVFERAVDGAAVTQIPSEPAAMGQVLAIVYRAAAAGK